MSKQNKSEVNLGNETYHRGFNDGLNGRPKTIKKNHRHVHRYHTGYRLGEKERKIVQACALDTRDGAISTLNYVTVPEVDVPPAKEGGFLTRCLRFFGL